MRTIFYAAAAVALGCSPAKAQQWDAQQTEVWTAVSDSWKRNIDNGAWHVDMVANAYGWSGNAVVPNSSSDIQRSSSIFGAEGEVLHYRLSPLQISVHGETAVAHYFAEVTETDHQGERENSTERCSDTLVKHEGRWKFLGWGCADLRSD
ncbi:nuclear transport factor 2 family protein [Sphingomicrobium clamense]|uniref:Nuclear transport factor 2 family protein n=1 Tax=Sphingomicrobium clamense TaxID=2851013 RepID=A0ABS6V6W0_9SPHN|nr:nuclear transport factor 2 family protein [Sphingomicrobium sp. B8]MBW0145226.1 nuclear transport factor 2 family protein [Sphingomicrobium sp. B8]